MLRLPDGAKWWENAYEDSHLSEVLPPTERLINERRERQVDTDKQEAGAFLCREIKTHNSVTILLVSVCNVDTNMSCVLFLLDVQ